MIADLETRLWAVATPEVADKAARALPCPRGHRGVPTGDLARVVAAAWRGAPVRLPDDAKVLSDTFGRAWEDGIAAIGLLSTCVVDAPTEAFELGLSLAERADDVATADAVGWLVLAPAALLTDDVDAIVERLRPARRDESRRAAVASALGFLPLEIEGPAAAALREKHGQRHLQLVQAPIAPALARVASAFVRDAAPPVQKGLRRVVRAWADADPAAVVAWAATVRGGLPKLLGAEVDRARRRAG